MEIELNGILTGKLNELTFEKSTPTISTIMDLFIRSFSNGNIDDSLSAGNIPRMLNRVGYNSM